MIKKTDICIRCGIGRENKPYGLCNIFGTSHSKHLWGENQAMEQTIRLSKKHAADLFYKLKLKQNPVWIKLREILKEQMDFCPCCGKEK